MNSSASNNYKRYVNLDSWIDALDSNNPEDALIKLFQKYHDGPNELQMAIDNLKMKYYDELLTCCLETLTMLSKYNHQKSIYFINQILVSKKFNSSFSDELYDMEEKYSKNKKIEQKSLKNDKQFINYFLKFAKLYSEIQSVENIRLQLKKIEKSVNYMNGKGKQFNNELQILKEIQQQQYFSSQIKVDNDDDQFEELNNPMAQKMRQWLEVNNFQFNQIQEISNPIIDQSNISEQQFSEISIPNSDQIEQNSFIQPLKNYKTNQNCSKITTQSIKQDAYISKQNQFSEDKQYDQYDSKKNTQTQRNLPFKKQNDGPFEYINKEEILQFNIENQSEALDNFSNVSYKKCKIEPSYSEFATITQANTVFRGRIFPIPIQKPYPNTDVYLNNNFFILREDYVKNFRAAVQKLKKDGLLSSSIEVIQNAFLYHSVLIENILVTKKGLQFVLTMNVYDPKDRKINWKRTKRLMPGSLLLISNVELELMLFGTVYEKPDKDDYGRVSVVVILIGLSTSKQIEYVNLLLSTENQLVVIENLVYYETYTYFLNCLQNTREEYFPFQDQLVFAKKDMPLPGYLDSKKIRREGIDYDIDLKFNLHQQSQVGRMRRINILRNWDNVNVESLDESQLKAIQIMLRNGITLIQGPPGTGKTFCGALGVRILLQNQFKWNEDYKKVNKPILIVCQTNHALDQFLQHILTFCSKEDIVRIGGRCKVEEFKDMLLYNKKEERKIRFNWRDFYQLKDELDGRLRNLLNLVDNVSYKDVEKIIPNLADLIVDQYLESEGLQFQQKISDDNRKYIIRMWLNTFQPREKQAQEVIKTELEFNNKLTNKNYLRKTFKPILVYRVNDLKVPISLNEDAQKAFLEQEEDEVDENEFIDSEDEENRKQFVAEDGEKNSFVNQLIKDKISQKRLLNRLGKENTDQFLKIMKEEVNNKNIKIWEMPQSKRNVITRFIFGQNFIKQIESLKEDVYDYDCYLEKLNQAYIEKDLEFIQTKKIVGVTLSGCAKYAEKLQNLRFNILIVEEAGEVLESKLVSILTRNINHLILIGDHQQLKPHLECYDLEVKYRANTSLFERLIKNGLEYVTLTEQRRMKTKFADFIRLIYQNYKDHSSIKEQNKIQIQGIKHDLLFFNHCKLESLEQFSSSKSNQFEAEMIHKFTNYLILNKIEPTKITILCTYVKQVLKLQKKVQYGIKVQTVDNYQGEENDIILLSLVRSNKQLKLGFVGIDNRVCVAFSRARLGFYVFGDFEFIELCIKKELQLPISKRNPDTSDLWLKIIQLANEKQVLMNHIPLECASHDVVTKIYETRDWEKVKGGGCDKTCHKQFPCGHTCYRKCHVSEHRPQDCVEDCERILSCGHNCRSECRLKCPPCIVQVEITQPICNHTTFVDCSQKDRKYLCLQQCEKMLSCGHQCQSKCYMECNTQNCNEEIEITLERCNHKMKIRCFEQKNKDLLVCQEKCQENLLCGHDCSGSCGSCFPKFHSSCTQECNKILNCGHKCKLPCQLECYQCKEKCQIECNCGDKCLQVCDNDCRQCLKPCKLQCQHSKCNKQCFEICDRQPCNERCQKILDCGCQCMGFCGEVCPKICQDSNHDSQIALKNTIYYQLDCECKHIMEAEAADNYFNSVQTKYYIRCPSCDKIMWKSSRYQDKIKQFKQIYNEEKQNKRQNYEITSIKLENLKDLVLKNLEYIQIRNLKDEMSFLDTILQDIKIKQKLLLEGKDPKMTYQEFMCIKAQLESYQKAQKIKNSECNDLPFLIYSEDYRLKFSSSQQWKVEEVLQYLWLYHSCAKLYSETNDYNFINSKSEIENSSFFLSKEQGEKILNYFEPYMKIQKQ